MPPVMHMDPYELCQQDPDALYCMSEYILVADKPSPLLNMIQEFSDHHVSHFNHSKLRYGTCVTQTCAQFYDELNGDLRLTLEACLNESLSMKYDLKVKILEDIHCKPPGQVVKDIDQLDIIVGTICIILLITNIVGSLSDYYCEMKPQNKVSIFFNCFSLLRNWKKLTDFYEDISDRRLESLKSFHGIRVISMLLVICVHSLATHIMSIENPQFLEEIYLSRQYYIFLNGTLIMQTFLILSSFLLVYNWLLHLEEQQISWSMLPKCIVLRWMRLTPTYALVLAITSTWLAHVTSAGPLWSKIVEAEVNGCRQYWWQHVLYINNYYQNSDCMVETWYLAVDMQLYSLGAILFLFCRTSGSRKIVLPLLFITGIIIPAAHVYFQDLDGILLIRPEAILNLFASDPHFKNIYTCGHTNITGYAIGMAMGYFVYDWQKQRADETRWQKPIYRLLYWSTYFLGLWCCYIGGIFYYDAPRQSVYVRVLYAAFLKPMFGLIIATLIIGFIFKFEDLYRSILEWKGWMIPSRLSYCAYLSHLSLIRNIIAKQTSTTQADVIYLIESSITIVIQTFTAALILWFLVEAPFSNIRKEYLKSPKTEEKKKKKLIYNKDN